MRYLCAADGCLRAGMPVPEPICAACGVRTLPEPVAPPIGGVHARRVLRVVLLTVLPGLLGMAVAGLWPLAAIGAVPARSATRRSRTEGRPTWAYWIAFAVTFVLTPVVAWVLVVMLLVAGGLTGSP